MKDRKRKIVIVASNEKVKTTVTVEMKFGRGPLLSRDEQEHVVDRTKNKMFDALRDSGWYGYNVGEMEIKKSKKSRARN